MQGRVQRIVVAVVEAVGINPRQRQAKQGPVEVLGEQDEASGVGDVDERVHGNELQLIEQLPCALRALVSPPAALDERQNFVLRNNVVFASQISGGSLVPLEHGDDVDEVHDGEDSNKDESNDDDTRLASLIDVVFGASAIHRAQLVTSDARVSVVAPTAVVSSAQALFHGFNVGANNGEWSTAIVVEPVIITSASIVARSTAASTVTTAIVGATLNAAINTGP